MFTELLPENWTNVDVLLKSTVIAGMAWLVLTVFIYWRRSVTNLTPVDVPSPNPDAQPDFLSIDHAKRKSALKRGDQFERTLYNRERVAEGHTTARMVRTICGYLALALSVLSLVTVISGSIWPDSLAGRLLADVSRDGRLVEVIKAHPIALSVSLFAVCLSIWRVAVGRKPTAIST